MIRHAERKDFELLKRYEHGIREQELKNSIEAGRILVMFQGEDLAGWLRYNLFWDNMPFMNMLYFLEGYRGKGYGGELVGVWEDEMSEKGYDMVLTSTLSNEPAQSFYRKNGYVDCGSLLLPGEALEIIFLKRLVDRHQYGIIKNEIGGE